MGAGTVSEPKKTKFRILWKEVGVALLVMTATFGLVWSMMTGWFG
jgi:hypothetical protein